MALDFEKEAEDKYIQLFLKYYKLGIPPQLFIDALIPVVINARKCSFFFSDQFWAKEDSEILKLSNELKKDFGIYLKKFSLKINNKIDYFLFKDREINKKIEEAQSYVYSNKNKEEFAIIDDKKYIEMMGNILGFPKCCLNNFINIRSDGFGVEDIASRVIIKSKVIDLDCFYAMEFYPCSPICKKAVEIGENIHKSMNSKFLGRLWELNLANNFNIVMNPDMEWTSFAKVLNNKILAMFE